MESLLRKQLNEVEVIGRLQSVELEEDSDVRGNERIKGNITVLVKEGDIEHNVRLSVYERKYTNSGNLSKLYEGVKKVQNEYTALADIEDVDNKEATLIRINGEVGFREYYTEDGTYVKFNNLRAKFYHSLTREQVIKARGPKAVIRLEGIVNKISDIIDREDNLPTGDKKLELINVNFFGKKPTENSKPIIPIEAIIPESLADVFESMYDERETGKFTLKINNYAVEAEAKEEVETSSFGNVEELGKDVVTDFVNNYEVIAGTEPYMDDKAYDSDMLAEVKRWRERAKNSLEEGYIPKEKQEALNAFEKQVEAVKEEVLDDDMPDF